MRTLAGAMWAGVLWTSLAAAEEPPALRAGTAAVDITPTDFPVRISGGFLERQATQARDRLYVRCLVLDDGRTRIAIAVVDTLLMSRELLDEAKRRASHQSGIPSERMLISATHTHSAPCVVSVLGTDRDEAYASRLPAWIAEAVTRAAGNLRPARIGWAVVPVPEYTHCRRWFLRPDRVRTDPFGRASIRAMMNPGHQNPDYLGPTGPADDELSVLSVQDRGGRPLALLANYSMHYVGAEPVSADYFGVFARAVAERMNVGDDGSFVAMMSNGTSGDLVLPDYSQPARKEDMNSVGNALAEKAVEACRKIAHRDSVTIRMSQRELALAVRGLPDDLVAAARDLWERCGDRPPKTIEEVYAREQVLLEQMPRTRLLKLQAIRIGDLGIAAIPCEVFGITGLRIKWQSPLRPTFTIELANGYDGYIPPPEQHELGGYTTWRARSSLLEVDAERKVAQTVIALLEEVSGAARREPTSADFPLGGYGAAVLAARPVAYWRLHEWAGPVARDASGHNHHARYEGGIGLFLDGPQASPGSDWRTANRAVHLAGGRIVADLTLPDAWTVEWWLCNYLPHDARPVTGTVLSIVPKSGSPPLHVSIAGQGAGTLTLQAAGLQSHGRTVIQPRRWYHLVTTHAGGRLSLHLDGQATPEITAEVPPVAGDVSLFIGGSPETASFEGRVDEAAVYNRALQPDELSGHVAAAAIPDSPQSGPTRGARGDARSASQGHP